MRYNINKIIVMDFIYIDLNLTLTPNPISSCLKMLDIY